MSRTRRTVHSPLDDEPIAVPPGDAAGEEPRHQAPAPGPDASAPELRVPGPDAGNTPDEGAIHWHEQPETGLAETRADAEAQGPELPRVT